MTNRAGQKGTKGETDRVRYFIARGWKYATRIPKKGSRDCGDMILDQAVPVMIESKETKSFTPSTFIAEMEAQIANAQAEFGFVIVKKRGTTDIGKYYALTTVEQQMSLIERVWSPWHDTTVHGEPAAIRVTKLSSTPPRPRRVLRRRAT